MGEIFNEVPEEALEPQPPRETEGENNIEKKRKGFVERLGEILSKFTKPTRKMKSVLGTMLVLSTAGWLARDKIVKAGFEILTQNPTLVDLADHQIESVHAVKPSSEPLKQSYETPSYESYGEKGTFTIDNATFNMLYADIGGTKDGQMNMQNGKIEIQDPIIRNLSEIKLTYLKPIENTEAFDRFLDVQIEQFRKGYEGYAFDQYVKDGSPWPVLRMAYWILDRNLNYDKNVEKWTENGGKWGGNPLDLASADGESVDKLLMEGHSGVCRHYAEAFAVLVEKLKEKLPDASQNVYAVPIGSMHRFHEWNMVLIVKGPHLVDTLVVEPQDEHESQVPVYDLLKTLHSRDIIGGKELNNMMTDYLSREGYEDKDDIVFFLSSLMAEDTPESLDQARRILSGMLSRPMREYREHIDFVEKFEKEHPGKGGPINYPKIRKSFLIDRKNIEDGLRESFDEYQHKTGDDLRILIPAIFEGIS